MLMVLEAVWHSFGEVLLAGALGGALRWYVNKERWADGIAQIFIGATIAYYFQPIAGQWFQPVVDFTAVDPAAARGCGAFLLGLCGIWPVQYWIDWARRRFEIKANDPPPAPPGRNPGHVE